MICCPSKKNAIPSFLTPLLPTSTSKRAKKPLLNTSSMSVQIRCSSLSLHTHTPHTHTHTHTHRHTHTHTHTSLSLSLTSSHKPAELLAKFVDSKLKKSKLSEEEIDVLLDRIMTIFRFLKSKDMFQKFYKKDLGKRLLLQRSHLFLNSSYMLCCQVDMKIHQKVLEFDRFASHFCVIQSKYELFEVRCAGHFKLTSIWTHFQCFCIVKLRSNLRNPSESTWIQSISISCCFTFSSIHPQEKCVSLLWWVLIWLRWYSEV